MIQSLYGEFLAHHCDSVSPDDTQRLTTYLCGYLSRAIPGSKLMRLAKKLGVKKPLQEFRRWLENKPYVSSKLWRAVWMCLTGRPKKAVKLYGISEDDLEWIVANLPVKWIRRLTKQAEGAWIKMPNYDAILAQTAGMLKYCAAFARRKLKFITKYDPSLTIDDFIQDMAAAALRAAYKSDHRTEDVTFLRNIARRAAKNYANSKIKYHTTKSRQRIVRERQTVHVNTSVKVYERVTCWRCKETSKVALCEPCRVALQDSNETWSERIENPKSFMRKRSEKTEQASVPQVWDDFVSTVSFLDAPIKSGEDEGKFTLLDVVADTTASPAGETQMSDLVHDLKRQPVNIQKICAVLLGVKDQDFDSWLHARYGSKADTLKDRRLAVEACEFFGVTRKQLQRSMMPVLGVQA